jgi:cell division protein FtsW (lipid II flippase)
LKALWKLTFSRIHDFQGLGLVHVSPADILFSNANFFPMKDQSKAKILYLYILFISFNILLINSTAEKQKKKKREIVKKQQVLLLYFLILFVQLLMIDRKVE